MKQIILIITILSIVSCKKNIEKENSEIDVLNDKNNYPKTEINSLLSEEKENPEMGLDFDPIIDGQDYPEEGFELKHFDKRTNFLVVNGKNWADYEITMKLILENKKWLIDGCGIINIPKKNRSKR